MHIIKQQRPDCIVTVDNCYGEFTEDKEPCAVQPNLLTEHPFALLPDMDQPPVLL